MKAKNVGEYILNSDPLAQPILEGLRKIVLELVPGVEEKIGYQMPWYRYHGMFLSFGAAKSHVGLYTMNMQLAEKYKDLLNGFKASGSTLQIPFGTEMPEKLVRTIVLDRKKQNEINQNKKVTS